MKNMRHSRPHKRFFWVFVLTLAFNTQWSLMNKAQAQNENEAFYIYQNDGHFDGFFYDEVQKISYSNMDTLGIEHGQIVSQEIVTADSVYRIMLSAIDSVGFVQPEVKYNPRLRKVGEDNLFNHLVSHDAEYEHLVFSSATPQAIMPKVGDVFASFDIDDGWSGKVTAVSTGSGGNIEVTCEAIDDITDIFERLVMVEQYDENRRGQLVHRRVAGHPEFNIGHPRRAEGTWEGDLFNFSLSAHIPLYASDDLNITLDPTIDGKLNIKTAWNISLFGDKYIGITTMLDFGVGFGFTIDGQIKSFFPSGIGGALGGVPIPATCPLLYLDIAPDAFLRGDAHVKFSAQSPKLQGGMWNKLEVKNWWPSMDIGFGHPGGNEEFQGIDTSAAGLSLELNVFVQGGMLFPMAFKSLPVLKKLFAADIRGQWFVGPKLSGAIGLDLTTMPWEDEATYTLMKNTKLSLHMFDADYEVKGTVETAFSGKKEVTLLDGGFNIFPPLDAAVVPEFGDCEEAVEERIFQKKDQEAWATAPAELDGQRLPCRVFSFEPSGAVIFPVATGACLYKKNEAGEYVLVETQRNNLQYYHIHQMMGQEVPKNLYPRFVLWDDKTISPYPDGEYKVCPMVTILGKDFVAAPAHEFRIGADEGGKVLMSPNFVHVDYREGGMYAPFGEEPYLDWCIEPSPEDGIYYADWYDDIDIAMTSADNTLKPNEAGAISSNANGLIVTGTFDKNTNEGSGTFTLSASCFNERATMEQLYDEIFSTTASAWVNFMYEGDNPGMNLLVSGSISHDIEGTFTVRKSGSNYYYTFTGNGTYDLDATALSEVLNPQWTELLRKYYLDPMEIHTTNVKQHGNAKMDYVVKVKDSL